jgi:hypothetical protein
MSKPDNEKQDPPLFIVYANLLLLNTPHQLYSLIERIESEGFRFQDSPIFNEVFAGFQKPEPSIYLMLKKVVDQIIYFANRDYASAKRLMENIRAHNRYELNPDLGSYEVAFEAVFGYEEHYCIDFEGRETPGDWCVCHCAQHSPDMKEGQRSDLFFGKDRIRCYECEQIFLLKILDRITDGIPFSQINGIQQLFDVVYNTTIPDVKIEANNISKSNRWKSIFDWRNGNVWNVGPDKSQPYKHVFNQLIRSFIAYDLLEFLENDDRRKIIKCEFCSKYSVKDRASKIGVKTFCSTECKNRYWTEQRKENKYFTLYMREYRLL